MRLFKQAVAFVSVRLSHLKENQDVILKSHFILDGIISSKIM